MSEHGLCPTLRSWRQHRLPTWYDDTKFGIFIHWSVSSLIGWALRLRCLHTERVIHDDLRTRFLLRDVAHAFADRSLAASDRQGLWASGTYSFRFSIGYLGVPSA